MNLMGIRKMGEMRLKMASSDSSPPPRVKFSLQSDFVKGDFRVGNRLLGICFLVEKRRRF